MFRLTREVRFGLNQADDPQLRGPVSNGYGGYPTLTGLGRFYTLRVTLGAASLDPAHGYLLNIKQIDQAVRASVIPLIARFAPQRGMELPAVLMERLGGLWGRATLERLELCLSPYLSLECLAQEHPMTRISQKFEFAASHRLYNAQLDEQANMKLYGKCSNPHGHGHNYELQVTVRGTPDTSGMLINFYELERIVGRSVIDDFDHKYLNVEVPEFGKLIPSVENIAKVIFDRLKQALAGHADLASVIVWETGKTWCEYSE